MTHGTSAHGGSLSRGWADAGQDQADLLSRWRQTAPGWLPNAMQAAGEAAPIQLLAASVIVGLVLGATLTTASQAFTDAGLGGATSAQLALLIAVAAVVALIALRPGDPAPAALARQERDAASEPSQLLAQMHHELRTPLNAMIGFSEVMLHELHGPLGHARYQEYAAHISESGGRLLKASEDALAVAATMSALVAERRVLRRERLPVAALLREVWTASGATPDGSRRCPRLSVADCAGAEIECDWQATSHALQHLLGEAQAHATPGGAITARSDGIGGVRCIEIAVEPSGSAEDRPGHQPQVPAFAGDGLRVVLARSLIEMQGATLSLHAEPRARRWSARVAFPLAPGAGGAVAHAPA